MGGWEGRLDSLKPKTQVKNWFCVWPILKIPLRSHRYLMPFYSISLQPSSHLYCGPLNTANPLVLPFYQYRLNHLKVGGMCRIILKEKKAVFFLFMQTCGTNFKCQTCDCHSCIYSLTTKSGEMSGIFSSHKALYPGSRDLINSTILSPSLAHIRLQVHLSVKSHHVTQYSFHFN